MKLSSKFLFVALASAAHVSCGSGGTSSGPSEPLTVTAKAKPDDAVPYFVFSNNSLFFDGSASSASDGGNLQFEWDFGEGAEPRMVVGSIMPRVLYSLPGSSSFQPARDIVVTLKVTHVESGISDTDQTTVTVAFSYNLVEQG